MATATHAFPGVGIVASESSSTSENRPPSRFNYLTVTENTGRSCGFDFDANACSVITTRRTAELQHSTLLQYIENPKKIAIHLCFGYVVSSFSPSPAISLQAEGPGCYRPRCGSGGVGGRRHRCEGAAGTNGLTYTQRHRACELIQVKAHQSIRAWPGSFWSTADTLSR
ncbi:hypothetical protein EVAR_47303_1 [Eumeta japonica]|uniref:Uncharacterized protein n=1 Tax=Eumeta variegata TaxID=151549 RepID=A0A4C1YLJ3_EUMVA|nr:hypothetical protein EVAR_47303_1 [Eumeta japonica]